MPSGRSSRGTYSLGLILSLGLLILGIGCMGWAVVNIEAESAHSLVAEAGLSSRATSLALEQVGETRGTTVGVQPARKPGPQKAVYSSHPKAGDTMGSLSIPALGRKLPIIEGTGTDDLKKGVGHFLGSVLPGAKDNCVLSGHRDTVFTGLGQLKIGDDFVVQTAAGTFTYRIVRIRIVHKDDRTVIVPTDHAVLTVSTCYPFHYVGAAPDRYVLVSDLVASR